MTATKTRQPKRPVRSILTGCALASLCAGCVMQLPAFVLPGSGTPEPRADIGARIAKDQNALGAKAVPGKVIPVSGPVSGPNFKAALKPGERMITVAAGETMLAVSRAHGIPVTLLMSANRLSDLTLVPGQQLLIPSLKAPPPKS
jgi:hypothetical protein